MGRPSLVGELTNYRFGGGTLFIPISGTLYHSRRQLIQELDRVPSQYLKKLTGTEEIWECRIRTQSNIYRIFSFFVDGDTLVLTHGYSKKSQKTDKKQIKRAQDYRRDYLARKRRSS